MLTLAVYNNRVVLRYGVDRSKRVVLTSVVDYVCFLLEMAKKHSCVAEDFTVVCSSSMDFPEESTKNKATIKLAHALREENLSSVIEEECKKMGRGKAISRKHRAQLLLLRWQLEQSLEKVLKDARQLERSRAAITAKLAGKLP